MHLQTINMLLVRKLDDVAENWVLTFELLVGGNLHIFEILVFQKGFLGGYNRAKRFYLIEFKMDSLSLSLCNEMTRQLLTFLLWGFLYTHVLHF